MTRVSQKPEERRQEILEAALSLFLKKGYNQTSVSAIVKKVGVAQGTFYYHFQNKDNLLEEACQKEISGLLARLSRIAEDDSKDPLEQLHAMTGAYLASYQEKKNLVDAIHSKENTLLHERMARITMDGVIPIVTRVIIDGRDRGVFQVRHPEITTKCILAAIEYVSHEPGVLQDTKKFLQTAQALEEMVFRILGVECLSSST